MCKTTRCCPLARPFFCVTLQVIVILKPCSNQPHEACGVDLSAQRISDANRTCGVHRNRVDVRHSQRNATPCDQTQLKHRIWGYVVRRFDLSLEVGNADHSA
jgi:hypothetical protein